LLVLFVGHAHSNDIIILFLALLTNDLLWNLKINSSFILLDFYLLLNLFIFNSTVRVRYFVVVKFFNHTNAGDLLWSLGALDLARFLSRRWLNSTLLNFIGTHRFLLIFTNQIRNIFKLIFVIHFMKDWSLTFGDHVHEILVLLAQ
jgi:hypothetical protein